MHVHITHNGETIGTLGIHEDGSLWDDGSPAAHDAIHGIKHGFDPKRREHGPKILDAIVRHLDRATYVHAHKCDKTHT
jgi:hypothetical protein